MSEENKDVNPFEENPEYKPLPIDESIINPFEASDDAVKILYRESITTSLLYKAMARIYKKICYKERHWFYIIGPTLSILH